ncbi:MAG: TIM barrel protein [Chloroflexota bacterium]|nr:TIM barrel protein [Chloroflexota bacterium]
MDDHSAQRMSALGLSSMWGIGRFERLTDFFAAGQAMGFDRFELNHKVSPELLTTFTPGEVLITSVHHPCPTILPPDEIRRRGLFISSTDDDKRQVALDMARITLRTAAELGARAVIIHAGRLDIDPSLEETLRRLCKTGLTGSPAFKEARSRLDSAHRARVPANLEMARRSLHELLPDLELLGLRLGVEVRVHYYQLPSRPEEAAYLLDGADPALMGYWHDTGHAGMLERLGFVPHVAWLESLHSRLIGVHFSDVRGLRDHLAPGQGELDFARLALWLPPEVIRTLEAQHWNRPEEIIAGVEHLRVTGCIEKTDTR